MEERHMRESSSSLAPVLPFIDLKPQQQEQAVSRFIDAGIGDGYLYELNSDGGVLCRKRPIFTRGQPAPMWAGGRLVHQSTD